MEKNLEEEYFKQAKKDDRNKDMNGKSPLDEFIDDRKKGIYEIIGSAVSIPEYLEESIRLAVQKHAEAVIPEKIEMKYISDSSVALRNGVIDEIKSASDKWIGV